MEQGNDYIQPVKGADYMANNLVLVNTPRSPRLALLNGVAADGLEAYCVAYAEIIRNTSLSQIGQDAAITKARSIWDSVLGYIETELLKLIADTARTRNELEAGAMDSAKRAFEKTSTPIEASRDIRAHLATMSLASDRTSFLRANVTPEVLFALGTYALPSLRQATVEDDLLAWFTDAVLEKAYPEQWAAIGVSKLVIKEVGLNLMSLRSAVHPRELECRRNVKIPNGPNATERSIEANKAAARAAAGL